MTLATGERAVFNFGKRSLNNQNYHYRSICEPDAIVQGYYSTVYLISFYFQKGILLLESYKRLLTENKSTGLEITENDKSLVAGIIMEYLVIQIFLIIISFQ
jgi:hypothetical protein